MNFQELLKSEYFRGTLILLVGITIGAIFYPTKRIEEKVSMKYEQEIASMKEQHSKEVHELTDKYDKQVLENKNLHVESEQKISKLTEEVRTLKSRQKTAYYKIVRPDGTVEIKKFTETEVNESTKVITKIQEEFKQKIDAIETKWSDIHRERVTKLQKDFDSKELDYKHQIEELQKSKSVSVNEKRFGIEAGILTNKNYYGHATMDVWGPTFIGVHGEIAHDNNSSSNLGIGLGLRF